MKTLALGEIEYRAFGLHLDGFYYLVFIAIKKQLFKNNECEFKFHQKLNIPL